jgi:glutathione S-transferase
MLTLYMHPLASFCWKPLMALYECNVPFQSVIVDLGNPESRAKFLAVWPLGKFPVLHDSEANETIPESTIIIEYLAERSWRTLIPAARAREVRLLDRFYDHYVQHPMQKIVADRLRPSDRKDPLGVEEARAQLATAYDYVEQQMATRTWAVGDEVTMADCAAAPALYYGNKVLPFGDRPHTAAYLRRLQERPSFARVLREAEPYFKFFPQ